MASLGSRFTDASNHDFSSTSHARGEGVITVHTTGSIYSTVLRRVLRTFLRVPVQRF